MLEEVRETRVPAEDHGQETSRVEIGARQEADLAQDLDGSLLRFIHEDDRTQEVRFDVRLPLFPKELEASVAVIAREPHLEYLSELPVKIDDLRLGPRDHSESDVTDGFEPLRKRS